jgi:hypothetical protein
MTAGPARSQAPVVRGDTSLPAGFAHTHAPEQARRIAEQGTILRVQVGSGVHGTSIAGQDDREEMGICLEPPEYVTGVARVPAGLAPTPPRSSSSSTSGTPSETPLAGWRTGPAPATWTSSSTPRASGRGWRWRPTRRPAAALRARCRRRAP